MPAVHFFEPSRGHAGRAQKELKSSRENAVRYGGRDTWHTNSRRTRRKS
jgi:hypothetical protein